MSKRFEDIDAEFSFERRIAHTGGSNIWLATPRRSQPASALRGKVVIKELHISRIANPEHVFNEKRVMELLTELEFPRAPAIFGTAKSGESLFIVMELIQGAPLHMHLPRRGFPCIVARRYFAEILSVMEFLHSHNILYRDLKLSNILLRSSDGRLCVCDFGLSKMVKGRTNSVCGTAHAMAPEISSAPEYGQEIDFWSLGILLFELMEGRAPFGYTGVSVDAVMNSPRSIEFAPGVHTEESQDLISQLLTVDPVHRLCSFDGIRAHGFFNNCDDEWWRRCHYRATDQEDPHIPTFDQTKASEFIFGPTTTAADEWATF